MKKLGIVLTILALSMGALIAPQHAHGFGTSNITFTNLTVTLGGIYLQSDNNQNFTALVTNNSTTQDSAGFKAIINIGDKVCNRIIPPMGPGGSILMGCSFGGIEVGGPVANRTFAPTVISTNFTVVQGPSITVLNATKFEVDWADFDNDGTPNIVDLATADNQGYDQWCDSNHASGINEVWNATNPACYWDISKSGEGNIQTLAGVSYVYKQNTSLGLGQSTYKMDPIWRSTCARLSFGSAWCSWYYANN